MVLLLVPAALGSDTESRRLSRRDLVFASVLPFLGFPFQSQMVPSRPGLVDDSLRTLDMAWVPSGHLQSLCIEC